MMLDTRKLENTPVTRPVRLRGIALPNEHGAWGILFEPLVAAVAVAFSAAALWVALAVIAAFLMRQPLKVLLISWKAGRRMPQVGAAAKFLIYYSIVFAAGILGTLLFAPQISYLPLIIAAPLAIVPIYFDAFGKSRDLAPELAGAIAITSSAAVIALAAGWTPLAATSLWVLLICRWIPSILYVRSRLLLEKGKSHSAAVPVAASAIAVIASAVLAYFGLSPFLAVLVIGVLLVRAALGLSPLSKRRKAKQIGILEVIYGVFAVLAIILGYHLGL
jgi:hypothetical protein